jgi:hypothetical protein
VGGERVWRGEREERTSDGKIQYFYKYENETKIKSKIKTKIKLIFF